MESGGRLSWSPDVKSGNVSQELKIGKNYGAVGFLTECIVV